MAKYSFEFKQKIVQEYLDGEGGAKFLAKKYDIPSKTSILYWIAAYKKFGSRGLLRSCKSETYSFDFKLHVVKLYLTTGVSYQDLALSLGMNNPTLINRWVNNFRISGPDALKPMPKGWRPKMSKQKSSKNTTEKNINTDSDYLKQLEEENLKLRIENAYLKELRRLRLEGTPQNKKRESSTASEEHSN